MKKRWFVLSLFLLFSLFAQSQLKNPAGKMATTASVDHIVTELMDKGEVTVGGDRGGTAGPREQFGPEHGLFRSTGAGNDVGAECC